MRTVLAALMCCAACAPRHVEPVETRDLDVASTTAEQRRYYTLWWYGARIGSAVDIETHTPRGIHLERRERVVLRRGDDLSATELVIAIDADRTLRATAITVHERDGAAERISRAERAADGTWRIAIPGEPPRTAPGDAEPSELLPLRVRRDGGFRGRVLLPGRGFAVTQGRIEATAPGQYRARLHTPHGELVASITTDRAGDAQVVAGGDGVVARRASASEVGRGFAPPEALAAGALAVHGETPQGNAALVLSLAPVDREPPPPLPGQRVVVAGQRWRVALDRTLPSALPAGRGAAAHAQIEQLAHAVARDIADDLGVADPADPRTAVAGDCTTHTLAFVARAADAAIDTRVVTGLRLEGDRLVRHRWALAWTGTAWLAVNPTFGEAPAAPRLLGLAVHGPSRAELALADAAFAGLAAASATISSADGAATATID